MEVQLYAEVSSHMKQRKHVVESATKETGSYTVIASSKNARFQWLLRYIEKIRHQDF